MSILSYLIKVRYAKGLSPNLSPSPPHPLSAASPHLPHLPQAPLVPPGAPI
eukprot:CAMPEP_0182824770 /NCGR_PEP_ID=MMETSP0006_2-20121128/15472_1 /TAXON_ID=97485 /ORGANISM="Prymnesium parvum, Strain Texoma1" /LENGTH=50 /DNA_ID=CAMNT_0024951799 /DNA_START=8 /DNA_END=157 /DNA_ORIENTATION=+